MDAGIKCFLGLVACMSFQGHSFTAQQAVNVMDDCGTLRELPPARFMQHTPAGRAAADLHRAIALSVGYSTGVDMEGQGVHLAWPASGAARKAAWLHTCATFAQTFHTPARWSHLEKWPWKR